MKKLKRKQKAAQGLQDVVVPQAGNMGQVANSTLSLAGTGMGLAGPVGAGVGAIVGAGMGLFQKQQQDEAVAAAKEKNKQRKASRAYAGEDASLTQSYQQYALGGEPTTKPIEVEKDELIFRKVGGKFKLKADFKGGKPHEKGGEDYQAQEGDIIFPGKQRGKVLGHLKNGNHSALEGMRLKLPKDTNPQGEAQKGVDLLPGKQNTLPGLGIPLPSVLSGFLPVGTSQVGLSEQDNAAGFLASGQPLNHIGEYDYSQDIPASHAVDTLGEGVKKTGGALDVSNALQYASLANNLIQGLSPAEKVKEDYYQPELLTYEDRSQPLRNQALQTRNSQFASARNSSGGNVQVQRALQAAADSNRMKTLQQVEGREQERADQVRQTNVQLQNQAAQINTQKRDQYAELQSRNNAAKQSYLDAATTQLTSLGNVKEQQKYQKELDANKQQFDNDYLAYLNNTTQFRIDEDTKNAVFNAQAPARYARPPRTMTSTTDEKGKIKTKVTQKR